MENEVNELLPHKAKKYKEMSIIGKNVRDMEDRSRKPNMQILRYSEKVKKTKAMIK